MEEISEGDLSVEEIKEIETQPRSTQPRKSVSEILEQNNSAQIQSILNKISDIVDTSDSEDEDETIIGNVSVNDIIF